jgi:hypothetical protein
MNLFFDSYLQPETLKMRPSIEEDFPPPDVRPEHRCPLPISDFASELLETLKASKNRSLLSNILKVVQAAWTIASSTVIGLNSS